MWREIEITKGAPGFWSLDGLGAAFSKDVGVRSCPLKMSRIFIELMMMML